MTEKKCLPAPYEALRHLLTDQDILEEARLQLIENAVRNCYDHQIVEELKKMNTYLALITDHKI